VTPFGLHLDLIKSFKLLITDRLGLYTLDCNTVS
jgi:hypothetical protein